MCGIAGFFTDKATDYRHAVAAAVMATHMEARGGHAWGWMSDNEVRHGLGNITMGMSVSAKMPQRFALHTRYGTTGKNTLANAHPFTVAGSKGTVTGVHNGIISNHAEMNHTHKRDCSVDSQHIFHNLANGASLDDLEGYGAIVYAIDGNWFMGRFNEGEMRIAVTDAGIFFASTREAISEALSFADIKVTRWLTVKDNTVYSLTASGIKKAYKIDAMGTRRRWNDLKDDYSWAGFGKLATATPASQECDLCGTPEYDLYELEGQMACVECYTACTDALPHGYLDDTEVDAYRYNTDSRFDVDSRL